MRWVEEQACRINGIELAVQIVEAGSPGRTLSGLPFRPQLVQPERRRAFYVADALDIADQRRRKSVTVVVETDGVKLQTAHTQQPFTVHIRHQLEVVEIDLALARPGQTALRHSPNLAGISGPEGHAAAVRGRGRTIRPERLRDHPEG